MTCMLKAFVTLVALSSLVLIANASRPEREEQEKQLRAVASLRLSAAKLSPDGDTDGDSGDGGDGHTYQGGDGGDGHTYQVDSVNAGHTGDEEVVQPEKLSAPPLDDARAEDQGTAVATPGESVCTSVGEYHWDLLEREDLTKQPRSYVARYAIVLKVTCTEDRHLFVRLSLDDSDSILTVNSTFVKAGEATLLTPVELAGQVPGIGYSKKTVRILIQEAIEEDAPAEARTDTNYHMECPAVPAAESQPHCEIMPGTVKFAPTVKQAADGHFVLIRYVMQMRVKCNAASGDNVRLDLHVGSLYKGQGVAHKQCCPRVALSTQWTTKDSAEGKAITLDLLELGEGTEGSFGYEDGGFWTLLQATPAAGGESTLSPTWQWAPKAQGVDPPLCVPTSGSRQKWVLIGTDPMHVFSLRYFPHVACREKPDKLELSYSHFLQRPEAVMGANFNEIFPISGLENAGFEHPKTKNVLVDIKPDEPCVWKKCTKSAKSDPASVAVRFVGDANSCMKEAKAAGYTHMAPPPQNTDSKGPYIILNPTYCPGPDSKRGCGQLGHGMDFWKNTVPEDGSCYYGGYDTEVEATLPQATEVGLGKEAVTATTPLEDGTVAGKEKTEESAAIDGAAVLTTGAGKGAEVMKIGLEDNAKLVQAPDDKCSAKADVSLVAVKNLVKADMGDEVEALTYRWCNPDGQIGHFEYFGEGDAYLGAASYEMTLSGEKRAANKEDPDFSTDDLKIFPITVDGLDDHAYAWDPKLNHGNGNFVYFQDETSASHSNIGSVYELNINTGNSHAFFKNAEGSSMLQLNAANPIVLAPENGPAFFEQYEYEAITPFDGDTVHIIDAEPIDLTNLGMLTPGEAPTYGVLPGYLMVQAKATVGDKPMMQSVFMERIHKVKHEGVKIADPPLCWLESFDLESKLADERTLTKYLIRPKVRCSQACGEEPGDFCVVDVSFTAKLPELSFDDLGWAASLPWHLRSKPTQCRANEVIQTPAMPLTTTEPAFGLEKGFLVLRITAIPTKGGVQAGMSHHFNHIEVPRVENAAVIGQPQKLDESDSFFCSDGWPKILSERKADEHWQDYCNAKSDAKAWVMSQTCSHYYFVAKHADGEPDIPHALEKCREQSHHTCLVFDIGGARCGNDAKAEVVEGSPAEALKEAGVNLLPLDAGLEGLDPLSSHSDDEQE